MALMQSYYPHNLQNPPRLLSSLPPPIFSSLAIHRYLSTFCRHQLSPILVFTLSHSHDRSPRYLHNGFFFFKINGYFRVSLSRQEVVCLNIYVDSQMLTTKESQIKAILSKYISESQKGKKYCDVQYQFIIINTFSLSISFNRN